MTLLHLPAERDLTPELHQSLRASLVTKVSHTSPPSRRHWVVRQHRSAVIAFAVLGLGVALLIPSIGVGDILRAVGLNQPPRYVTLEDEWRDALTRGVHMDPSTNFPNLPPDVLRTRLESGAQAHGFHVVSLELLRPKGLAPLITVETANPARLAAAIPSLMNQIDPRTPGDDQVGWAFEGIFLKALDETGEPFLVVYNHFRGADTGGGQWARSEDLLPYLHG
jgi:hypothetical protein